MKQIRKGLKETRVWPLLTERKDVDIFLRECENSLTPLMLLPCICWPSDSSVDDDDEHDCSLEDRCHISGYLHHFIEAVTGKTALQPCKCLSRGIVMLILDPLCPSVLQVALV